MKNVLKGIVICLCAIFLMSHNVGAITSGGFIPNTAIGTFWVSKVAADPSGNGVCNDGSNAIYTKTIYTGLPYNNLQAGADYLVAIPFFSPQNNNSFNSKIPIQWRSSVDNYIWVKETEIIEASGSQSTLYMIIHVVDSPPAVINFVSEDFLIIQPTECLGNTGYYTRIEWQGLSDYRVQLQNLSNSLSTISNNMPSQQSIDNINNSVQDLNDAVEDHYQAEQDALDNISDQDASDLSGDTDNQQSTNLIGIFSSFVNALSNITASNNCNITLEFPTFAGGSQTVNVCQNKDKGGNLVAIFSSLTLIAFYIPLALKLLSMILNEIRSFTNG